MAENKMVYKRKNFFIDKMFQARFILKFCGLVALGGVLTIAILYIFSLQSTTVSILNSRVLVRSTSDFLLPILIQTIAIVIVFISLATITVTLFVSHKIAGPLYRFKKVLKMLEGGDYSCEFRIRHKDQLQDMAAALNEMIKKNRSELIKLRFNFTALKENLERISKEDVPEDKKGIIIELNKIAKELDNILNYFKT